MDGFGKIPSGKLGVGQQGRGRALEVCHLQVGCGPAGLPRAGPFGVTQTGPGSTRYRNLSPRALALGASGQLGVARTTEFQGVARLQQFVAAGVGVGS